MDPNPNNSDSESDSQIPPLEDIEQELKAEPHGKNIKGIKAEGDAPDEMDSEDKDGWLDILNNTDLRKKVLKPAEVNNRPTRGSKVLIRIVTRLYEGPIDSIEEPNGLVIPDETHDQFSMVIGDNDLHQGLDLLVPLMDLHETARLLIKPRFGYGPIGNKAAGIPEDAVLDLEVELLQIFNYDNSMNPIGGGPDLEPGEPNPITINESLQERIRFGNYKKCRGNFWFERGEYSLAIQCYRGAIRYLDASESELTLVDHFKSGQLKEQTDDIVEKVRDIEDLIDKRAQTFNNLAATQLKLQSYDQALRSVEDSLLLRPDNVKALYRRAKIRAEKGDLEEAISDLKQAAKIDPKSEAIAQELDRLNMILARQLKEQRQLYRRMMQFSEDDNQNKFTSKVSDTCSASTKQQSKQSIIYSWFSTTRVATLTAAIAAIVLPSWFKMSLDSIKPEDDLSIPPIQYEYLDHTADVQIHSWSKTLADAFEQCAIGMFGYITDLKMVDMQHSVSLTIEADDLNQLLYRFLDELLFLFCADPFFVSKKVKIVKMETSDNFRIEVKCYGEVFNLDKHTQGTEVKAITYSAMQIHQTDQRVDIYVIVDI